MSWQPGFSEALGIWSHTTKKRTATLGVWRVLGWQQDEKTHVRRTWQGGKSGPAPSGLKEWCLAKGVFPPDWSAGSVVRAGGQGNVCILQIILPKTLLSEPFTLKRGLDCVNLNYSDGIRMAQHHVYFECCLSVSPWILCVCCKMFSYKHNGMHYYYFFLPQVFSVSRPVK